MLAIETLQKALVIEQDHIVALIHLAELYLKDPTPANVDLAAGLLNIHTKGAGWDVPEAWYFLARACQLQGRKERERECLLYALRLQETRCIRPITSALPRVL